MQHVLDTAAGLGASRTIVVTGHGAAEVEQADAARRALAFVRQEPQLGTGHALQQAAPLLDDAGTTLILNGDVPLIEAATLQALVAASGGERLALLDRRAGRPARLRPHRPRRRRRRDRGDRRGEGREPDAARDPRDLHRRDGRADRGAEALAGGAEQRQRARASTTSPTSSASPSPTASPVVAVAAASETEVLGVNSPAQLADLERRYQRARRRAR